MNTQDQSQPPTQDGATEQSEEILDSQGPVAGEQQAPPKQDADVPPVHNGENENAAAMKQSEETGPTTTEKPKFDEAKAIVDSGIAVIKECIAGPQFQSIKAKLKEKFDLDLEQQIFNK